jgi:hypothetical protein
MAERVVDALELVEIETEHGAGLAARDAMQGLLQTPPKQDAVRQIGQGIMQRHVGNLCLGEPLLRDIGKRIHEPARRHRLVGDGDDPPIGQLLRQHGAIAARAEHEEIRQCPGRGFVSSAGEQRTVPEHLDHRLSGHH